MTPLTFLCAFIAVVFVFAAILHAMYNHLMHLRDRIGMFERLVEDMEVDYEKLQHDFDELTMTKVEKAIKHAQLMDKAFNPTDYIKDEQDSEDT